MKLSDLSKLFLFLIIFINFSNSYAEDEIDIWKKKSSNDLNEKTENQKQKIESPLINKNKITTNNIIQEQNFPENNEDPLYGIWDPDKYNFELSMWANTDGKNIQKIIATSSLRQSATGNLQLKIIVKVITFHGCIQV